jgi:hypothetical protein
MLHLAKVEDYLVQASETEGDSVRSVRLLVEAYNLALKIIDERKDMWQDFTATWEKGRLPKNASIGGRDFLHVQDDVKDHFADRRIGLDYMLAPFERMHVEKWSEALREIITGYAHLHGIPIIGLEVKRLED